MNVITPNAPSYLAHNFKVSDWDSIKPMYVELSERVITNASELWQWFKDRSELDASLSEDMGWRYIKMTCDTANEANVEAYQYFVTEIQPHLEEWDNVLNNKALSYSFIDEIKEPGFEMLVRHLRTQVELFREENIPLNTEVQSLTQQYGAITGAMTVEVDGVKKTLQQASLLLKDTNRSVREKAYFMIANRRLQDKDALDDLFDKLIALRHQIALNAGFSNFRDYMFKAMERFDYSTSDCLAFHDSVEKVVVPLLNQIAQKRKNELGVDQLRPWDLSVDAQGRSPLKPFETGNDLLEKSIECLSKVDAFTGNCIQQMHQMGHLDLESRIGKAPGGYNYPLDQSGVPFIFMNAASQLRDVVTMVHEAGHALHSFLVHPLPLSFFKHPSSEIAELASMSMELLSMEHWDTFFDDDKLLSRAKQEHLESVIETLPWVAAIDAFQHWIYEHPTHSREERRKAWNATFDRFRTDVVDWNTLEEMKSNMWQKQLHLYEVPFYYIEYGFAQLGAVSVYKNFKENPEKALKMYKEALSLGASATIPEVYKAAGVQFDFSIKNIESLMLLIKNELND